MVGKAACTSSHATEGLEKTVVAVIMADGGFSCGEPLRAAFSDPDLVVKVFNAENLAPFRNAPFGSVNLDEYVA